MQALAQRGVAKQANIGAPYDFLARMFVIYRAQVLKFGRRVILFHDNQPPPTLLGQKRLTK